MPDCCSAMIQIGGPLSPSQLPDLAALIVEENLGIDWDASCDATDAARAIEEALANRVPLTLMATEAPCGAFPTLEAYCLANGLSLKRGDDAHYTWNPTVVFWEPGMDAPREWAGERGTYLPHLSAPDISAHLATGTLAAELLLMERAYKFAIPLVAAASASAPADLPERTAG